MHQGEVLFRNAGPGKTPFQKHLATEAGMRWRPRVLDLSVRTGDVSPNCLHSQKILESPVVKTNTCYIYIYKILDSR